MGQRILRKLSRSTWKACDFEGLEFVNSAALALSHLV